MALILQDVMLEELLCSVCEKYLSVLPVKVYPDGSTKCGRCHDLNDNGIVSLYSSVVQKYLFKCVNRYEGCNKLLPTSEVLLHEKNCTYGSYKCPECEVYRGSAYELLQHYKKRHPRSVLKKNMFQIPAKQVVKERYLYLIQDNIFFILVENIPNEKCLYLSAVSVKPFINVKLQFSVNLQRHSRVKFIANIKTPITPCPSLENFNFDYFKIETGERTVKVHCTVNLDLSQHISFVNEISLRNEELTEKFSEKKKGKTKSLQTIPIEDVFGVIITDTFKETYPHYKLTPCGTALFKEDGTRIELTCSNCKHFTGGNVFNCRKSMHLVCWECNAWCGICDSPLGGWNADISSINELLLLPCRWKCKRNFSGDRLRNHEATCSLYVKVCPERLCRLSGVIPTFLKGHLSASHNIEMYSQLNLTSYLKNNKYSGPLYFLQNDYIIKFAWVKFHNTYEVVLEPMENMNDYEMAVIFDNKTYKKVIQNKISFTLDNNPKIYLKRIK